MNSRSASRTCLALRHAAFEDPGALEPVFRGPWLAERAPFV